MTGLTLHPNFPATPYVYVSYDHDAPIGGTRARLQRHVLDTCGPRLHRDAAAACRASPRPATRAAPRRCSSRTGARPTTRHAIQDVRFGPDGMLYVSGGDGARVNPPDHGQYGNPSCATRPTKAARCAPRTCARCATRSASTAVDHPDRSGDGRGRTRQPDGREHRSERASHHRRRVAQPVPLHVPTGHQRDLDRRRRLEDARGDRPPGRTRPTAPSTTSVGRVTRARCTRPAWDTLNVTGVREPVHDDRPERPYFAYRHDEQTAPGGDCVPGDQGSIGTPLFYTGR